MNDVSDEIIFLNLKDLKHTRFNTIIMASLPLPTKHVRRCIVDLKDNYPAEFGRFVMALKNLEDSDDWYRICGIHGNTFNPNDTGVLCPTDPKVVEKVAETGEPVYCKHRVYSFIAWHTPYLYQYELLLNKYSKSKCRDYITLPWLDLTDFSQDLTFLNDPVITILYDDEPVVIANPLASAFYYDLSGNRAPIRRCGYLTPTNNEQRITLNTVRKQLFNTQFAKSYEEVSSVPVIKLGEEVDIVNAPIEWPHNTCHDVIGGDNGNMADITISAFDPLFWLHHSNMDRFYYNWFFTKTDGFRRPLSDKEIKDSTRANSHAPFFADTMYETDPNKYQYGWTNDTGSYQVLNEALHLDKLPYTYEQIITPSSLPQPTHFYINILNIPIPMETVVIKAYLVLKGQTLDREHDFAGLVVWLGINRRERHCSRCEVTRVDLQIEIDEYCKRHNISTGNSDNYELVLEATGKQTATIYTKEDIVKDGSILVHMQ